MIRAGAQKAGCRPEDVQVCAYASISADRDQAKAVGASKIVVAFIVAGSPENVLERHGIGMDEARTISEAISRFNLGGDGCCDPEDERGLLHIRSAGGLQGEGG